MIANVVVSKHYLKLQSRDIFLALPTNIYLLINITIPIILKRPSYSDIYSFIKEGCFSINPVPKIRNMYRIIGNIELDNQKVIKCFREARETELWRFYMEKSQLARLDKLLLNPEILICDKHKL